MDEITHLKQELASCQKQRKAANQRLDSLITCTSDWLWEVDTHGVYTYINGRIEDILGYTADEIIGTTPFDLMPENEAQRVAALFMDIATKQLPIVKLENWNHAKDGSLVCLETNGIPLINDQGEFYGYRGLDRDITERKVDEEIMKKMSLAIEESADGIIISDHQGTIEYINPAFSDISGYRSDEIVGENTRILKSNAQNADFYQDMWDTISHGKKWSGMLVDKKKDGSFYPAMMSVAPMHDENGLITHYVANQRDMSTHEQLESELRQAQKLESIGTLVGGISHDFNNMLASIIGNVYLANIHIDNQKVIKEKLNNIKNISNRSADMVKQLLTYARKENVSLKDISLHAFMEDAFTLAKHMVPENIHYTYETCACALHVKADATQLQQALMNMTSNAYHAVKSVNNPHIYCRIEAIDVDDHFMTKYPQLTSKKLARITVQDNGYGIKKNDLAKVIEPFFTTKGAGEGTGLGLSMVSGSIQMHGGVFEIESEQGKGTSCYIYLPLIQEKPEHIDQSQRDVQAIKGNGELILLVDDQNELREITAQVLEELNFHVIHAKDGDEALQTFQKKVDQIALVFTDVVMPKLSGYALMKEIWQLKEDMPVIFASGYNESNQPLPQSKLKHSLKITKPYGSLEMSLAIHKLLKS